jgi:myo-inositol-1(or 4)-monophosphatase
MVDGPFSGTGAGREIIHAVREAAIRAASIAQGIVDSRQHADEVTSKGGIDLVTGSDVACEDAIRAELLRSFPDYPVIGEERGGQPVEGKPYWLVDPICGTRSFASDIPLYCTNIAFVDGGAVTCAAIGVGLTEEILFAEAGSGAWMRTAAGDRKISVSDQSNTIWIDGRNEWAADTVRRAMLLKRWYVWMFSSTVAYTYLASGRISGILHFGLPSSVQHGSVHTAAGCFIAGEAGARVTDIDSGKPWNLQTRSFLLAATDGLHQELLSLATR